MQPIGRLEHFLAVIRHGGFNAAARAGNLTQPALTKSIRQLEDMLGVELLVRDARGVSLTAAGKQAHARAIEIETTWNALLAELGAQATGAGGTLHLGAGAVYSAIHFPPLVDDLLRSFPGLEVQVSTGSTTELFPALRSGEIICYAGTAPTAQDGFGRDFETVLLGRQANAVYVAADHPLALYHHVTPADLARYSWLTLYSALNATSAIVKYCAREELPTPHIALRAHSLRIMTRMLEDHRYIACLPEPLGTTLASEGLVKLQVDDFAPTFATGLTYRRSVANFATIRRISVVLRRLTGEGPS